MSIIIFASLFVIALISMVIFISLWVYKDAKSKGLNGALWVLIVIFTQNFIGLILYFLIGRKEERINCTSCNQPIRKNSKYCNFCGKEVVYEAAPKKQNSFTKKYLTLIIVSIMVWIIAFGGFMFTIFTDKNLAIMDGVSIGSMENSWGNKWNVSFKASGMSFNNVIKITDNKPKTLYVKGNCKEGILTLYIIKDNIIKSVDLTEQNDYIAVDLSDFGNGKVKLELTNSKARNAEFNSYWE